MRFLICFFFFAPDVLAGKDLVNNSLNVLQKIKNPDHSQTGISDTPSLIGSLGMAPLRKIPTNKFHPFSQPKNPIHYPLNKLQPSKTLKISSQDMSDPKIQRAIKHFPAPNLLVRSGHFKTICKVNVFIFYRSFLGPENWRTCFLKGLKKLPNLITIHLKSFGISETKFAKFFRHLKGLFIAHNNINALEGLSRLHNLTVIDLTENPITALIPLKQLEKLNFSANTLDLCSLHDFHMLKDLSIKGLEKGFYLNQLAFSCPFLTSLKLEGQNLSPLDNLGQLDSLINLSLYSYSFDENDPLSLTPLSLLVDLQKLDIRNACITTLKPLSQLENLTSFSYRLSTTLSIQESLDLSPLNNLPYLAFVDLKGNKGIDITSLKNPNIISLNISQCDLDSPGNLENFKKLERLVAGDNRFNYITGLSKQFNTSLQSCGSTLKILDLSGSNRSIIKFIPSFCAPFPYLEILNLCFNSLFFDLEESFTCYAKSLPNLKKIDITGCIFNKSFSKERIKKLQKAFPKIHIEYGKSF